MKKFLSLILSGLVFAGVLSATGCKPKDENKQDKYEEIVLANFEQWAPDFQILRLMGRFGAVDVNTDANFVKSGKQSAKLSVQGGVVKKTVPYIYVQTASEYFGYDYSDFSGVQTISAWLYNTKSTTENVEVGVIAKVNSIDSCEKVVGGVYSLTPGWNKIVYRPDLALISLSADVTSIPGIYFGFENANVSEIKDAPVFYLDDVTVKRETNPAPISDVIEFDPGEILDFEKDYQAYVVTPDVTYSSASCAPDLSVVYASEYGLTAPSGLKCLRVVTHPGTGVDAWPKFSISEKVIYKSGFKDIPKEEWGNYRFAFEVYAEKADGFKFYPELFTSSNQRYAFNFSTRAKQWVTVYEPFTVHNFDGWRDEHITAPGSWKFAWAEYPGEDYVFYFDNFRFEKIN